MGVDTARRHAFNSRFMVFVPSARPAVPLLAAVLALSGCSSPGDSISKVKILRLDPGQRIIAADPAIDFERRYRLHGAITSEEVADRKGNYYTVQWSVADRLQPVTLRMEYRQAIDPVKIQTIEQTIDAPRRSNTSEFHITGPAFAQGGRVVAWRLLLMRGKQVLATRQSYLWE
jgi:hypothetical protein